MNDSENNGDIHYKNATKELNKFSWWFGPSQEEKECKAMDEYVKAGDQYKLAQCYDKAGDAYQQVADLYYKHAEYYYAAGFYIQSAEMYKNIDKMLTEAMLSNAIKLYHQIGNFSNAGKYTEMLIEVRNDSNLSFKLNKYLDALYYYEASNLKYPIIHCLDKMYYIAVQLGQYEQAIVFLNKICSLCTKYYEYSKHYQSILVLKLVLGDIVDCRKTLNSHMKEPNYIHQPEYQFCNDLLNAYENNNVDDFMETLKKNKIPWQHDLLMMIGNRFHEDDLC